MYIRRKVFSSSAEEGEKNKRNKTPLIVGTVAGAGVAGLGAYGANKYAEKVNLEGITKSANEYENKMDNLYKSARKVKDSNYKRIQAELNADRARLRSEAKGMTDSEFDRTSDAIRQRKLNAEARSNKLYDETISKGKKALQEAEDKELAKLSRKTKLIRRVGTGAAIAGGLGLAAYGYHRYKKQK